MVFECLAVELAAKKNEKRLKELEEENERADLLEKQKKKERDKLAERHTKRKLQHGISSKYLSGSTQNNAGAGALSEDQEELHQNNCGSLIPTKQFVVTFISSSSLGLFRRRR